MELVILFLILTFSGVNPQQIDFLKLPPSLLLNSAQHKLGGNEIEPLIANILGIPSDMDWQGLERHSVFDYPKANLLFMVEGLNSPADLGFDCQKCIKVSPDILQDRSMNFDSLISSIQSNFDKRPLLVHAGGEGSQEGQESSGEVSAGNLALEAGLNAFENVAGVITMSQVYSPKFLDVSRPADFRFFAELSSIDSKVKELELSQLRPFIRDSTPDVITFLVTSAADVIVTHGASSPEVKEMKTVLAKFITEVSSKVSSLYKDKVAIELLTMPSVPEYSGSHVRLARSVTSENKTVNPNLSESYNEDYAAIFNIGIWTSIVLVIALYGIVYGFWNMNPGTDGIIYRMTTMKTR